MKKFYTLFILGLLVAGPLFSQHFYIGIGGSVMSTWITNVKNDSMSDMAYKTKFGPSFGLNAGYQFNKHLAVFIQPGYGVLGQKMEDVLNDTTYKREIKLNYLQIPLLFKFNTGGSLVRFYAAIGPQFNILLSAKQTFTKSDEPFHETFINSITRLEEYRDKPDVKDRYNSLDILARLDLGVEFIIVKKVMINAGLSLGYGLMDINSSDWHIKDTSGNYAASHNLVGGLTVGVSYIF